MRVAVLLAGLTAVYATNGAAPTDNNVCAELAALMEQKIATKNEASAAVDAVAFEDDEAWSAAYKSLKAAKADLESAERLISLQGENMSREDAEAFFALRDEAGFKYNESRLVFKALSGQEPKCACVDWE